jgi:predicted ATP-grasp superfamily ATP-dependent carboligase
MAKQDSVLVVAASGRALAASARRGGFIPLVADFFGDQDTLRLAYRHCLLPEGLATGMCEHAVLAALEVLSRGTRPIGVVCGTGFEDRPQVLATIAARWRLIGNSPGTVARLKDPLAFAALCGAAGIPHPPVSLQPPADPDGWLRKRRGGAGGSHINAASSGEPVEGTYFQRLVTGTPMSALVLADGRRAQVLGCSAQWSAPTRHQPFRFGGAVAPAPVASATADRVAGVVAHVMAQVALVGLNSFDFLRDGEALWLLEINPRPGATLDLFEPEGGSLFAAHVAACGGTPLSIPQSAGPAKATAIVYADHDIAAVPVLDWPGWTADRPHPGTCIKGGEPLCTVFSVAPSADEARRMVAARSAAVLSLMVARAA